MILRDTRAVYDRLRDETPSVATSSFATGHTTSHYSRHLARTNQADQEVTTEQVTAEPVLVGAGMNRNAKKLKSNNYANVGVP